MNLRFRAFLIVATLALGAISTPALPQDAGWFIGASAGQSTGRDGCTGLGGSGIACDDTGTGWRVFAGYQFNPYLGFEIGYADFGKLTKQSIPGVAAATFEGQAIDTVLLITMPLSQQFSIFGKWGIFNWELDRTITGVGAGKTSVDGNDTTWGLGAKYNLSSNVALRLEWQRYYDVGDAAITGKSDIEVWSLGIVLKF
jgi:OOP family OmpA-OmpF porin